MHLCSIKSFCRCLSVSALCLVEEEYSDTSSEANTSTASLIENDPFSDGETEDLMGDRCEERNNVEASFRDWMQIKQLQFE